MPGGSFSKPLGQRTVGELWVGLVWIFVVSAVPFYWILAMLFPWRFSFASILLVAVLSGLGDWEGLEFGRLRANCGGGALRTAAGWWVAQRGNDK